MNYFYSRSEESDQPIQPSTSGLSSQRKVGASSLFRFGATSELPNHDSDLALDEELNSGLIPRDVLDKSRKIVESYKSAIFQCFGGESSQVFVRESLMQLQSLCVSKIMGWGKLGSGKKTGLSEIANFTSEHLLKREVKTKLF